MLCSFASADYTALSLITDHLCCAGADDVDEIWTNVVDLCVKTVLAVQPQLSSAYKRYVPRNSVLGTPSCSVFEILGFDIMLDSGGAPWLIEINHAPSFKGTSKQDTACKKGVIEGAFEMLGVTEKRKRLLSQRVRKQWSKYMWDQARAKSQEKQTPQAAVTAALTLAERDRRAWVKGSPAKRKSLSVPRRTPKSPDRTLPPLSGGDSREDFYTSRRSLASRSSTPGGGSSGLKLSRDEFAAADPWRIVSRERDASSSKSKLAGGGGGGTGGGTPNKYSVHARTGPAGLVGRLSSGVSPAPAVAGQAGAPQGGYLSDEDPDDASSLRGGYEDEEEEGLDVEDEDGEEVLEGADGEEERLMNRGPSAVVQSLVIASGVELGQQQQQQAAGMPGATPSSSSSPGPSPSFSNSSGGSSGGGSGRGSNTSSSSASSSSRASSTSSVFTTSTGKDTGSDDATDDAGESAAAAGSAPGGESKPTTAAAAAAGEEDGEEEAAAAAAAAADTPPPPTYRYTAPTAEGAHGYIRIYSEMSQNDREKYADVIAAAARIFERSERLADDGDEDEQEEEEAAVAAEAEEGGGEEDEEEDDCGGGKGGSGAARPSSSRDNGWNPAASVSPTSRASQPHSRADSGSSDPPLSGGGGGAGTASGRKKTSRGKKSLA